MQIIYEPEIQDGEQRQGDTINKYGYLFEKGKVREVHDSDSLKFLLHPCFREKKVTISAEVKTPAPKKRGRPRVTKLNV